ncbi:hypothetical protein HdyHp2_035 [Haloarcula virus Hardyhisp2]|uniref:Uncharacterized protein n=1 Tax=Haloarcula virus Hardyhisp2 TaxID=2811386 RepID=A0A898KB71_9VIRU|nr:hypothetical protein QIT44_gp07 [Haloarcula virus Hardyhisp2]QSJ05027.1 hypothetical protein HdyHp2_035 [Haloarcula virus Hardyhisp2]
MTAFTDALLGIGFLVILVVSLATGTFPFHQSDEQETITQQEVKESYTVVNDSINCNTIIQIDDERVELTVTFLRPNIQDELFKMNEQYAKLNKYTPNGTVVAIDVWSKKNKEILYRDIFTVRC